jgi:hypothetical protein
VEKMENVGGFGVLGPEHLCLCRSHRRLDAASLTDANGLKAWTTGIHDFFSGHLNLEC